MRETSISGELMDMAQEVMRFGERCVQAGRSWLSERREDMNNRNEEGREHMSGRGYEHERWEREREARSGRGAQSGYPGSGRWQTQGQGQYGRGQGEYYGGRQFGERMQGGSGERMQGGMQSGMQGAGWEEEGGWEYEGGPERFSGYSERQQRPHGGQREFGVYGTGSGDYYAGRQGFGARGSFGSEFSTQGRGAGYGEGSGYTRPHREQEQGRQWRFGGRGQAGGGYRPYGTSSVYGGESAGFGGRASLYAGRGYRDEGEMSGYGGSELYSQELRSESSGRYGTSPGQYGYGGYGMERHGFRGKGPRSFIRSDERITEEINERLTDDDDLDAGDINVRVSDGKVTLEGSVEQRWMKHRAEDIADSCMGVKDVDNRIQIKSASSEMGEQRTGRATGKTTTSSTTTSTGSGSTGSTTPH